MEHDHWERPDSVHECFLVKIVMELGDTGQ